MIIKGDALDLIQAENGCFDLVVTDPPYAFGGSGDEHAISATVAVVLRESAMRLNRGRWMVVMCASSWRSMSYMVESVRGVIDPVRVATWCKPVSRSKVTTPGWAWASVSAIAFRKGKAIETEGCALLDHMTAAPVRNGRRAELPTEVAQWAVRPFAVASGRFLDPFAGSGAIVRAAAELGMQATGYEKSPANEELGRPPLQAPADGAVTGGPLLGSHPLQDGSRTQAVAVQGENARPVGAGHGGALVSPAAWTPCALAAPTVQGKFPRLL